jgi:iron complex outermembrane receptor protein
MHIQSLATSTRHINHRDWGKGVCLIALATAAAIGGFMPAMAQAETPDAPSEVGATTEIVVTALHRRSTLQTTPMSISAVDGLSLRKANIQDISQVRGIPGLSFVDAGPANVRVVVRGIQTVGEPTVGVYYDETPVTGVVNATNDAGGSVPGLKLFDVDHLEVLRGPQGTLYGSGAMGGAVRVLFNKPTDRFESVVDVAVSQTAHGGTGNLVQGMINLPIVPGKFSVRAVAFDQKAAGYIDNTVLGFKDIDEAHGKGGRLLTRLTLRPNLTIDAGVFYQENHGDRPIWNLEAGAYNATNQVRLTSDDLLTIYTGSVKWDLDDVTIFGNISSSNRKDFGANGDPSYFFQTYLNNPTMCARLRGGGASCSPEQQTAFNDYVQNYVYGVVFAAQKAHASTAEFRVSSRDQGRLTWTGGVFYSERTGQDDNNQFKVDQLSGLPYLPWIRQTNRLIDDELKQTAVFGDASYAFTDKLKLTLGTRFFHYQRVVAGNIVVPLDLIGANKSEYTLVKSSESKWVSKVNLAYQHSANLLVYAEAAQGFRPGGVNQVIGLPAALQPYRSDSLWNYEAGIKTRSFNNHLTVNVDAYRIDWTDMQVQGLNANGPQSFISNAGAARIQGAEIEAAARFGALMLHANAGYSDARLTEDQSNPNISATGKRGNRIPYVPKITGSVEGEYGWSMPAQWRGFVRGNATYVGESFSEFRPDNIYYRKMPSYTLVNARLGFENDGPGLGVYLYVNNLFDRVALTSATATAVSVGHTLVTSMTPRTVGLNIRKTF